MKTVLRAFAALFIVLSAASCVSTDAGGNKWASIKLPPDPLRDALFDWLSDGTQPPVIEPTTGKMEEVSAPPPKPVAKVSKSTELEVPPANFMFSWRELPNSKFEYRGVTGPSDVLGKDEFFSFLLSCGEKGWKTYQAKAPAKK
jgi:hypothetical protein